jgi:sugar/nucleoside kinase (ribokinase family)
MAGAWHFPTKRSRKSNHLDCFWTDVHTVGHDGAVSVDQEPASGARAARVLVVGDANPDLVLTGDVVPRFSQVEQLLDDASLVIGGSASITAHGLARLGRPVSLLAAVGDDHFGRFLTGRLEEAGVDVRRVAVRRDLPTGLTVALNRGADRAMLTLPGALDSLTEQELYGALDDLGTEGLRHVHVASLFLLPSLVPCLPAFLAHARERGLTTSLDTNGDPSETWLGVDDLLPHLDVLLPNRAEAVALGGDDDPRLAAAGLAARGPLTVVKDGPAGAWAVAGDGEVAEVGGTPLRAVDTTGAGDTFDAAFLDAWLDGVPVSDALVRAVAAGARSVGAVGGTAGQPTRDQIVVNPPRLSTSVRRQP